MRIRRSAAVAAVGIGVLATLLPLTAQAAPGNPSAVALYADGTRLGRFNVAQPSAMTPIGGVITGLDEDDFLIGIDRRVQNGRLYGVGDEGGIYLMAGNRATLVGRLGTPDGTSFGVDFNPAANALRLVSNTGQNLRMPFGTSDGPEGLPVADAGLSYASSASGIVGAAYTNNDLNVTTGTTLFDLDTTLEQLAIQAPANAGSLSPTGKLGVSAGVDVGFDIYSERSSSGRTVANDAFAAIPTATANRFYSVDLLTGGVTYIGRFPVRVTDIAVDIDS
jgi:Domain of unknown function (DUF4394)